ncbi:MAG: hypothetical protein ACREPX_14495 [Rhodanobacteraceae bacterium]
MRIFFLILLAVLASFHTLSARAAPAQAFAAEIPFRSCEGLICIDVALDGAAPRTLMLDTGNANSTLTADAASALGWALTPAQRNGAAMPGIFLAGKRRVAFGAVEQSTPFFVFDRALLGEYKPPVDGSLSYGFFEDRILQIDYPRHVLRISNVISTPVPDRPGDSGTLRFVNFGDNGPQVLVGSPFMVNGKRVRAQIDTVFTGTMLVYNSALDALGLSKQGKPELFRYTSGGVNLMSTPAQDLGFGTRTLLRDGPIYFVGESKNPVRQPGGLFEATVGNALFERSVVTMDFHAMTLDVQPGN